MSPERRMLATIGGRPVVVHPLSVAGIRALIALSGAGLANDEAAVQQHLIEAALDCLPSMSRDEVLDSTPLDLGRAVRLAATHPQTLARAKALGAMLPNPEHLEVSRWLMSSPRWR